jgi:flagellar biosynthetic protein FlhB
VDEEKTEQATPQTRQKARERGEVAKSRELTSTFVLLVGFLIISLTIRIWGELCAGMFNDIFGNLATIPVTDISVQSLNLYTMKLLFDFMWPLFLTTAVTSILLNVLQTKGVISSEPIRPKLTNIDPIRGVKRMFSPRGFVELLKAILKITLVSVVAYLYVKANLAGIVQAQTMDPSNYVPFFGGHAFRLGLWIIAVLMILAILDYIYQVHQHEKDMMLTKTEAKEEYKRMEGDPLVRSRIRTRQRQIAMTRMLKEVPRADVVITNPTRFAVAIRYEADMPAPQVVAKGKGVIAERIIAIAKEFNVHIHSDPPLARALYSMVEVGGVIPYDFYVTLAEILAYVYKTKKKYQKQRQKLMAG